MKIKYAEVAKPRKEGLKPLIRFMERMRKKLDVVKSRRDKDMGESEEEITTDGSTNGCSMGAAAAAAAPMNAGDFGTVPTRSSRRHGGVADYDIPMRTKQYYNGDAMGGELDDYLALDPFDMDPALSLDRAFQEDLEKVNRAFRIKLLSLRKAHELTKQKLVDLHKLRKALPMDVTSLMTRAAERSDVDKKARKVVRDAAGDPFMQDVVTSLGMQPTAAPPAAPRPRNPARDVEPTHERLASSPTPSVSLSDEVLYGYDGLQARSKSAEVVLR